MNALELLASLLTLLFVIGTAKQRIWAWPAGILGSALAAFSYVHVSLYAEGALQILYVLLGVYGWYQWQKRTGSSPLKIIAWPLYKIWIALGLLLSFGALVYWILTEYTEGAIPLWDALLFSGGLMATYMEAKRVWHAWLFWIPLNALGCFTAYTQGLQYMLVLYCILTGLSVYGMLRWKREFDASRG